MNNRSERCSYFTLVEMVSAMAVMIFVGMIIGTASISFYNTWKRSSRVAGSLKKYMAIDRVADLYFRNMTPFKWNDGNNESRFVFEGKNDSVCFTAIRRNYSSRAGALVFIRLKVEDDGLVAEYSDYPRLPWDEDGECKYTREVIASGVSALEFLYAESDSGSASGIEWFDEWVEEEHAAIPLAVRMRVVFTDGSSEVWLRRPAGVSKNSVFGNRETLSL